jgi:putative endonuclease
MPYFVYILQCSDNSFYCGSTHDLEKRVEQHNYSRSAAKYTRGRRPVKLVYYEKNKTLAEARARESEIKRLKRSEKERLIETAKIDDKLRHSSGCLEFS